MSEVTRISTPVVELNHREYIVMHYLVDALRGAIQAHARGRVLDIGCGNKPYEKFFGPAVTEYVGCDVEQSNERRVDVICPATRLPFEDASFDTVFSTQVLEHVSNPGLMLSEAARVLRAGGTLILSAPFTWELHEQPHDYFRFTKYGLSKLVEESGFAVESITSNGGKWAALFQLSLNITHGLTRRRSLPARALRKALVDFRGTAVVNALGVWLDDRFHDEVLTLNYVIVGRRH